MQPLQGIISLSTAWTVINSESYVYDCQVPGYTSVTNSRDVSRLLTFDTDYMLPKLFLKMHGNREVGQRICQLIQSIYGRVNAFEAVDLSPDRQWNIIHEMLLSPNIHCYDTIAEKDLT